MKKLLLLHLCLLFSIMLSAQTAGDVDPTFAIGDAFNKNGTINVTAIQSDGKIIVAGDFYTFEGASTNRIVRLNADGTRDNSFNAGTGFNGSTFALAIQPDGKILVGGNFTTFNNISSNVYVNSFIQITEITSHQHTSLKSNYLIKLKNKK